MRAGEDRISGIIAEHGIRRSSLLNILRTIKKEFGYVDPDTIKIISTKMNIPSVEIEGVLTFYSFLGSEKAGKYVIRICRTISCAMVGKASILDCLEKETNTTIGRSSKDGLFTLKECNCLGMCDQGPALLINDQLISSVTADKIHKIVEACKNGTFESDFTHSYVSKIYKKDRLSEFLDSTISEHKYMKLRPEEILDLIETSGLRGRGGAGYPTGLKWRTAAEQKSEIKYLICNADEGEPGTFKDRYILDNYPDKVVEGILTASKAIGATEAIIYLRGEYSYLKDRLTKCISSREIPISIHMGCGSYVCGEETALIKSIEGNRGEATIKPPYPVIEGFNGYPTVVNNVETLLDAYMITEKGADYFKSMGTERSKGTKFFSISGDLENPGIYEIPFGITISDLLEDIGAKNVKSVQMGGASGTNYSYREFNDVIAYEAVPSGGSIIIFNKDRNMLEVAKNFIEFFVDESCGQCVPCKEGTSRLLEGINSILRGIGNVDDIEKLIELGNSIMSTSKCGLGQVCAKAFISIVNNNWDDIEASLRSRI